MIDKLTVLFFSIISVLLTRKISISYKQGPVKASAGVSLIFGLLFKFGIFNDIIPAVVMGASFAAMSSERVITNRLWMVLAGAIFSFIFIFASDFFEGNGGGLGITACIAVIITLGIMRITDKLMRIL